VLQIGNKFHLQLQGPSRNNFLPARTNIIYCFQGLSETDGPEAPLDALQMPALKGHPKFTAAAIHIIFLPEYRSRFILFAFPFLFFILHHSKKPHQY
jgi:hypothetical protein